MKFNICVGAIKGGLYVRKESCNLSLIGKFLTCKAFNQRAAISKMRRVWGMQSGLQIIEVGTNLFQFKFQNDFDLNRVLKRGLWCFDNQLLMLKRWHKGMTTSNVKLECASLWVQIWGALLTWFHESPCCTTYLETFEA